MPLVFAYGSNMDHAQMKQRCPTTRLRGLVRLYRHRLDFAGWSFARRGAVATVRPIASANASVPGVVWDVSFDDLKVLDAYEGAPVMYWRRWVQVVSETGRPLMVHCYALHTALPGGPSPEYLGQIASAYKRWGFGEDDKKALRLAAGTLNWSGRQPFTQRSIYESVADSVWAEALLKAGRKGR